MEERIRKIAREEALRQIGKTGVAKISFEGTPDATLEKQIISIVPKLKRPEQGDVWQVALRDIPEGLGEQLLKLGGARSWSMLKFGVKLADGRTYQVSIPPGGLQPQLIITEPE